MFKYIKALIVAIITIASLSVYAEPQYFVGHTGKNNTVAICTTPDATIDMINAKRKQDWAELRRIMKHECTSIPSMGTQFEIIGNSRYISEIYLYNDQCQLVEPKWYIDNDSIYDVDDAMVASNNASLMKTNATLPPDKQYVLYKQSPCGSQKPVAQYSNTKSFAKGTSASDYVVCMSYNAIDELNKVEGSMPKGCFFGAPSEQAVVKSEKGMYYEVNFVQDDGSLTDSYWLNKDSFQ